MSHRHIFRMTYYENMAQFISDGEICAKNSRIQPQHAISYTEINNKRGQVFQTPDGETLHDFVPFYFSPITAMSYTIHRQNVPLRDPQGASLGAASIDDVVFLVSNTTHFADQNTEFWFTNVACNTLSQPPIYRNNLGELEKHINWPVFDELPLTAQIPEIGYRGVCKYFNDRDDEVHNNRSAERMAEFMIKDALPLSKLDCIVTKREQIKNQIESWMDNSDWNIPVYVKTGCYF